MIFLIGYWFSRLFQRRDSENPDIIYTPDTINKGFKNLIISSNFSFNYDDNFWLNHTEIDTNTLAEEEYAKCESIAEEGGADKGIVA